jgi:hypothetical protein
MLISKIYIPKVILIKPVFYPIFSIAYEHGSSELPQRLDASHRLAR